MRRLLLFVVLLALLTVANVADAGTQGGKGVVQRSWISVTSGGAVVTSVNPRSVQRVYVILSGARRLEPVRQCASGGRTSGNIRAVWTNRTLASDKRGTRLFAWIGRSQLKQSSGTWQAILTVGGVTRSVSSFRSAVPVASPPPPPPPPPSPPPANNCDPNYEGACVPIVPYDLNCSDIEPKSPWSGTISNRFDADGDGYGCESYG